MSLYIKEIRGAVNSEITNEFASNLGNIIGNFMRHGKKVVVGRDVNASSQMIKRSITAGILAAGVDVIDFGVSPIPAAHYGSDLYDTDVIVTITASHLYPEEIDIKLFSDHDIPLVQRHAEKVPWDNIGQLSYVHDYVDKYINAVLENTKKDLISSMAPKVVIDCANGSAVPFMPEILSKLGSEAILFGCQPTNITARKFAEPTPESISLVSNLVNAVGADMGIAMDNDGDRVVFIDEQGNIIRDQTILGLLAREALIKKPGGTIVSSVAASMSLDEIVKDHGGNLIKAPMDSVLEEIIKNNAAFGGDDAGTYVFPEFQNCFDAIFASVKVLEIVCKHNKTLSTLVNEIPEYPRTVFSVECEHDEKDAILESLRENLGENSEIDTTEGIKVIEEDSFVLVRPSRFEPLLRVYVEAKSSGKLQKLSHEIKKTIEKND
ncbi:phosphomannomutase [Methanobacterium oryzae]|uniref:phosphomannomutase n=1 Tax=Methanobacterium oryzae TaxID=69540 RepID=UPI003D1D7540